MLELEPGGTFSKQGNYVSCAWDRCPSSNFNWPVSPPCTCEGGLNSCLLYPFAPTVVVVFERVRLIPVESSPTKYKLEAENEDGLALKLGVGQDAASGSQCFDDPLRGGFSIDLTGTGYVFAEGTSVQLGGWSANMRVSVDGEELFTAGTHASATDINREIPSGGTLLQVNCGGWTGGCTSTIIVTKMPVTTTSTTSSYRRRDLIL